MALAFAIPALAGGIAGFVYTLRAQPISAEVDAQRETYRRLHARYAGIGNLDKVLAEVLARRQMVDELHSERPDADAIRDLVKQLPRDMQLLNLSEGKGPTQSPVLSLRLRVFRPEAPAEVIELLKRLGFTEPRVEPSGNTDPHKMLAEFSANVPSSGKVETP